MLQVNDKGLGACELGIWYTSLYLMESDENERSGKGEQSCGLIEISGGRFVRRNSMPQPDWCSSIRKVKL